MTDHTTNIHVDFNDNTFTAIAFLPTNLQQRFGEFRRATQGCVHPTGRAVCGLDMSSAVVSRLLDRGFSLTFSDRLTTAMQAAEAPTTTTTKEKKTKKTKNSNGHGNGNSCKPQPTPPKPPKPRTWSPEVERIAAQLGESDQPDAKTALEYLLNHHGVEVVNYVVEEAVGLYKRHVYYTAQGERRSLGGVAFRVAESKQLFPRSRPMIQPEEARQ